MSYPPYCFRAMCTVHTYHTSTEACLNVVDNRSLRSLHFLRPFYMQKNNLYPNFFLGVLLTTDTTRHGQFSKSAQIGPILVVGPCLVVSALKRTPRKQNLGYKLFFMYKKVPKNAKISRTCCPHCSTYFYSSSIHVQLSTQWKSSIFHTFFCVRAGDAVHIKGVKN